MNIPLGVAVGIALVLLLVVAQRTYRQFIHPWVTSLIEGRRLNKILNGDPRLLNYVQIQQQFFRMAECFPDLPETTQHLLLSSVSYHIVARYGEHWDRKQSSELAQHMGADLLLQEVARKIAKGVQISDDVVEELTDWKRK